MQGQLSPSDGSILSMPQSSILLHVMTCRRQIPEPMECVTFPTHFRTPSPIPPLSCSFFTIPSFPLHINCSGRINFHAQACRRFFVPMVMVWVLKLWRRRPLAMQLNSCDCRHVTGDYGPLPRLPSRCISLARHGDPTSDQRYCEACAR